MRCGIGGHQDRDGVERPLGEYVELRVFLLVHCRGLLTFPRVGYHPRHLTIGVAHSGLDCAVASVCRCAAGSLASESGMRYAGLVGFVGYVCENTAGPAGKQIDERR
ncbi:hypothetical protein GCM10027167_00870 [Nocardia heshunensis]